MKLTALLVSMFLSVCALAQEKIAVTQNVPYDTHPACVLDVAQPLSVSQEPRPAIVIVHGGGWAAGDKRDAVYTNLLVDYAMKGYVTFSVNYRLISSFPTPSSGNAAELLTCIEDVEHAVAWIKEHAADYGVDPSRIGSFGHSAGGHLSLMLGVKGLVTCAVGGAPPTEIGHPASPWNNHPEWWPIGHIKQETAPMLILQGSEDPVVRPQLTEDFVQKMHKAGNKVEFIEASGHHGFAYDQALDITRPAMDAFYARHLQHPDPTLSWEQIKMPDGGGSGPYKAVALKEKSLPDFVVYRPLHLQQAVRREGKLPILLFANGGCMDTSVGYERFLTEVASHGYVVVAIGQMQVYQFDREEKSTPSSLLTEAMDWIISESHREGSDYCGMVDVDRIAAAGHSCGGAQVLCNAKEPNLKTYLILNAGMGQMEMAGASARNLKELHAPIIYMSGGEGDVAYKNAEMDYLSIQHVPAVWADNASAGHGGTYNQPFGGSFARMAVDWLDLQLKGKTDHAANFVENNPTYREWTIQSNGKGLCRPLSIRQKNGKDIYGILCNPATPGKHGVAIISHGFNGTHHFGKDYFQTLNQLGYAVYTFDFPCGSVHSMSDNNTLEMSVTDEKNALKEIVAYFQKQKDVDRSRIVLIGESQGGFVSALAASELKSQISNLVLIYPALCIPDDWNKRYPQVEDIPEVSDIWGVKLGKKYMMDIRTMKPFDLIGQYKGRVLIVHGTDDKVVPVDYARRAEQTYDNALLKIIDHAGHGFNAEERRLSNQYVQNFLSHPTNRKVLLDTHYNHEVDRKTGKLQHYTWDDTSKWGGFSQFGDLFLGEGASLCMLNEAPTAQSLKGQSVYIIVDPDHVKDNPSPNYMNEADAQVIAQWVKQGGRLLVMTNDKENCDLEHINILTDQFGLHFNDTTILQLAIPTREKPDNVYPLQGTLQGADRMYMRGTSSIRCGRGARRLVWTPDNDVVIAEATYGKGLVIAVADPWIYNEYIYHTLLPDNYDNASPALLIVKRLLGDL